MYPNTSALAGCGRRDVVDWVQFAFDAICQQGAQTRRVPEVRLLARKLALACCLVTSASCQAPYLSGCAFWCQAQAVRITVGRSEWRGTKFSTSRAAEGSATR